MRIGICDDEADVCGLIRKYIEDAGGMDDISLFDSADGVREHIKQGNTLDILCLDIGLGSSQDGMALAGELKGSQIADGSGGAALPLVIFIIGIPERMPEAFGVRAFHFLVKPVKEEQFRPVLESARKAVAYAKSRQTEKTITLVSGSVTNVLKASDICYVESLGRKLVFHLRAGVTESYGKISEIGSELGDTFYQIHRSYFSFKSRTGHPQGCSSASRKNVALCINGNLRMLMFR